MGAELGHQNTLRGETDRKHATNVDHFGGGISTSLNMTMLEVSRRPFVEITRVSIVRFAFVMIMSVQASVS